MKQSATQIIKSIKRIGNEEKIKNNKWFFKTGKGEYGEGDKFIGLSVPQCREVSKQLKNISDEDLDVLFKSPFHEIRLISLLILVSKFEIAMKNKDNKLMSKIYKYYLSNTKYVNNWDLVDLSAHKIVGNYLYINKDKVKPEIKLTLLAKSKVLWERRISIISTAMFINHGIDRYTYLITDILLHDKQDLIHKASGWMLREAGKRVSINNLKKYLDKNAKIMPRTMLRYSIEKLSPKDRLYYLKG